MNTPPVPAIVMAMLRTAMRLPLAGMMRHSRTVTMKERRIRTTMPAWTAIAMTPRSLRLSKQAAPTRTPIMTINTELR
jgi:hypothetical protein